LPQPKETLFNKFERDLMELARQIKVKQIPFSEYQNLFLFQKHLIKYAWIKNSWGAKNDYTATILKKEIEGLLKKKSTLSKDSQNKIFTKNQDRRKAIIKKYAFNKTIRAISDLSTLFSLWLDLRKENALKFVEIEDKFLKEFSVRFKLDYKVLHLFDITEIEKAVKNRQFFKDQARKRQSLFMLIHTQKRVSALFGKKVRGYLDKLAIPVKFKRVGEINGISAMPGRVRGRIKIIHHQNQFKKFRTNDILVTGMTRPDFINIMKKAKAIVTDDGGLTCHAAIISRELKIPCIISTKIATKVLKDGMMVEVDANKGVVKKVKITK
jgi:phosphoenolpyruvate synthase/pyruvate phosphate dikinase